MTRNNTNIVAAYYKVGLIAVFLYVVGILLPNIHLSYDIQNTVVETTNAQRFKHLRCEEIPAQSSSTTTTSSSSTTFKYMRCEEIPIESSSSSSQFNSNDPSPIEPPTVSVPPPVPEPAPAALIAVDKDDYIYSKKFLEISWDTAPIVDEEYKLIFFAVPKIACSVWKQALRRMKGYSDWRNYDANVPHRPQTNGLTYLYDYSIDDASRIMTDPTYTRAIFLREPKQRFLSAFLDKAIRTPSFLQLKCCNSKSKSNSAPSPSSSNKQPGEDCVKNAQTLDGFLNLTETCKDSHWDPQYNRMESKYWPYINFIGSFELLEEDAERLLRKIGAWEKYGASGWGSGGNSSIFHPDTADITVHGTQDKVSKWYTPSLEKRVEKRFAKDYEHFGSTFNRYTT